jgi:ATP-dependent RNA helicase RhlE
MHRQLRDLRGNPRVIVATPGRLIDHLQQKSIKLDLVSVLVLDEADRMLDMGFAPQLKQILTHVPKERQTMLFSATMEPAIVNIATAYMKLPIRIEVAPQGTAASRVTQEMFFVHKADKLELLKKILNDYKGSVLVFSRTKYGAKAIAQKVRTSGHTSAEIHSNRSLNQRLEALNGFKLGKYRVLIATDIAARGIDVTGIELVVNFDLPENASDYVHRIGRTGRAGHEGHAISFATPDQKRDVYIIERLIKKPLKITPTPTLPKPDPNAAAEEREERSRGFGGSRRGDRFGSGRPSRGGFAPRSSGGDRPARSFAPRGGDRPSRPPFRSDDRPKRTPSRNMGQGQEERPAHGASSSKFGNRRPKRQSDQERAKKMYWAK